MRFRHYVSVVCLFVSFPIFAVQRTFVSAANGNDANNCSRLAPCRNFAAAMPLTDSGGEVVVLDSGGYGTVAITQAVQIIAPAGVHAAVTSFSVSVPAINIDTAGVVRVKGLALTGASAVFGIRVVNAAAVYVEGVSAFGFFSNGFSSIAAGYVSLKDCLFAENGSGVSIDPQGGSAVAEADGVRVERNTGVGFVIGNVAAVVTNSVAAANGQYGYSCSGSGARMTLENDVATGQTTINTAGVVANNGCIARLSNCTIVNNYNAVQNYGNTATVLLRGNNTVEDYTNQFAGNHGTYSPQ